MAGKVGAPLGNKNGSKNKLWSDTLRRVAMQDPEKLRKIAERLFDAAADGDIAAMREIGDRLDGKAKQQTEISGEGGGSLVVQIVKLADDTASS